MKFSTSVVLATAIVAASAAPARQQFRRPPPPPQRGGNGGSNNKNVVGAAFFMTNDPEGNFVMASTIGNDGTLTTVRAISTQGQGAHGQTSPIGPDALFSQGSLKVAGNNLFVVNPGSNTLSMFALNPNDPANAKLVGTPIDTTGEFPMSVVGNTAGTMACVLNGGAKNGVACFSADSQKGLTLMSNTVRDLGLNQTTPATGPAGSASHVIMSEDGKQLIASVKGVPPNPGFLAVWDIAADGSLSEQFNAITPPSGGLLPFGMAAIPGTQAVLATDPGDGFDVIDLSQLSGAANAKRADASNSTVSAASNSTTAAAANSTAAASGDATAAAGNSTATTAITSAAASNVIASGKSSANKVGGQVAVCWAALSKKTGTIFMTDIGTSTITEVSVDTNTLAATIVKQYPQTAGSATIDDAVGTVNGNDFLYVLAANATSVDVLSLKGGKGNAKNIQNVNFAKAAQQIGVQLSPDNVQGMTVFIPA